MELSSVIFEQEGFAPMLGEPVNDLGDLKFRRYIPLHSDQLPGSFQGRNKLGKILKSHLTIYVPEPKRLFPNCSGLFWSLYFEGHFSNRLFASNTSPFIEPMSTTFSDFSKSWGLAL